MDEAERRLSPFLTLTQRTAVMVLARRAATKAVKAALQRKGLRKPTQMSKRELASLANAYLAEHRELIAEAKATIAKWTAEGLFGKRAQRAALERFAQTAKA